MDWYVPTLDHLAECRDKGTVSIVHVNCIIDILYFELWLRDCCWNVNREW